MDAIEALRRQKVSDAVRIAIRVIERAGTGDNQVRAAANIENVSNEISVDESLTAKRSGF
jgi:hypothetical protein